MCNHSGYIYTVIETKWVDQTVHQLRQCANCSKFYVVINRNIDYQEEDQCQ